MKKVIFICVIAVAGLVASCGDKKMAAGQDSINVADTTEQVDSLATDSATVESTDTVNTVDSCECQE